MGKGGRPARYDLSYKIQVLRELGVQLTDSDIKRLKACKTEKQLDRVAHEMIMR